MYHILAWRKQMILLKSFRDTPAKCRPTSSAVQCSVQLTRGQVAAPVAPPANQDTAATHLRGAGRICRAGWPQQPSPRPAKRKDKKAEGGRIFTLADFACFWCSLPPSRAQTVASISHFASRRT